MTIEGPDAEASSPPGGRSAPRRPATLWTRWLQAVGAGFVVFGLALALGTRTALFDAAFGSHVDPAFFSGDVTPEVADFQAWIYAVLGATLVLVGVFVLGIATFAFARGERWAAWTVLVGVLSWFVLDQAMSVRFGVWFNVAFNAGLLVLAMVPLVGAWVGERRGAVGGSADDQDRPVSATGM